MRAQAAHPIVAHTAGDAQEPAEARSAVAADRRRQETGRPGFRVREDSDAVHGPGGHWRDVQLWTRPSSKPPHHATAIYLLRSNLTGEDPAVLWTRYVPLTRLESVFRSLKRKLSIRPIRHQLEHRADAHIRIAFLAYLSASHFQEPPADGRHTQPEKDVQAPVVKTCAKLIEGTPIRSDSRIVPSLQRGSDIRVFGCAIEKSASADNIQRLPSKKPAGRQAPPSLAPDGLYIDEFADTEHAQFAAVA